MIFTKFLASLVALLLVLLFDQQRPVFAGVSKFLTCSRRKIQQADETPVSSGDFDEADEEGLGSSFVDEAEDRALVNRGDGIIVVNREFPNGDGILLAHEYDFSNESFRFTDNLPLDCYWNLSFTGYSLALDFEQFELPTDGRQCLKNYVQIFAGTKDLGAYCGSGTVPSFWLVGAGKYFQIKVHIEEPFRGFRIKLTSDVGAGREDCDDGNHFSCPEAPGLCLPNSARCNGLSECPNAGDEFDCSGDVTTSFGAEYSCFSRRKQIGTSGNFSSLTYPNNYISELNCVWEIEAPPKHHIRISFDDLFEIMADDECKHDTLEIFSFDRQRPSDLEPVAELCGEKRPDGLLIRSNGAYVKFRSGAIFRSGRHRGFHLKWVAVPDDEFDDGRFKSNVHLTEFTGQQACLGGDSFASINVTEGIVMNLGYGNGQKYKQNMQCRWRFHQLSALPEGKKFKQWEFRFDDFDVPFRDSNCTNAFISVKQFDESTGIWHVTDFYCNRRRPPMKTQAIVLVKPTVEIEFSVNLRSPRNAGRGFRFEFKMVTADAVDRNFGSLMQIKGCGLAPDNVKQPAESRLSELPSSMVRIAGRKQANPGAWKWPVNLLHEPTGKLCGGAIIHPQFILTAAQCFGNPDGEERRDDGWSLVLGRHIIFTDIAWDMQSPVIRPEIEAILVNENYSRKARHNKFDIALVKLTEPVEFGKLVAPLCLPSVAPEHLTGRMCVVLDWGTETMGNDGFLGQFEVPLVDVNECKSMDPLYQKAIDPEQMLCAGYRAGGIDACQGDLGAPLACYYKGHWELQGIASWRKGCAGKMVPGVYTRVWNFIDWIDRVINKNSTASTWNE